MGGNGSTTRKVSFGLDEEEKVTVIQGVKLSEDVLRRMREAQRSDSTKPPQPPGDSHQPPPSPKPRGPSVAEIQEEMRKKFEREQALVQEQLARLAEKEREREAAAAAAVQATQPRGQQGQQGQDELAPALLIERNKTHEELEKANLLARQLERKERELSTISAFYKEQLQLLENKNLDDYKQTTEQYNQAATKAESHIQPRCTESVCLELQAQVLQCYREHPQQTLLCSGLAKQYMTCIQQAKKNVLINHG